MKLVIVESPTKAKTISKFLPKDYKVESSYGHVRDLPPRKMGIDIENNFQPFYEIPEKAQNQVNKLKKLAKNSEKILYASDEDREGEAIAWHLDKILKPKEYDRITFHEITKKAIKASLKNPRQINKNLVDAQQARRILDRLVGFELSPFLWQKVARGLSAGRVQSVCVRLVVEKEREREAFKQDEYWTLEAEFGTKKNQKILAKLHAKNGKTLKKLAIKNQEQAGKLKADLTKADYRIADVQTKQSKKQPPTPFRTSTLQQAANNRLYLSAKNTMRIAQQLYEGIKIGSKGSVGLITYMRTDSLNLSNDFLNETNDFIKENIGSEFATEKPRRFTKKAKGAQEAHEAIRPTHVQYSPESIKQYLDDKQYKLYSLIWQRAVASQMSAAVIDKTTLDINSDNNYSFRATGQIIKFPGFLKVYQTQTKENILPEVKPEEKVTLDKLDAEQHFTQPPARYSEASLIKVLEEYGIGRPSTYAPTIATIQDRKYVIKEDKKLKPTDMGIMVNDILVKHFSNIVDYKFTAKLEDDLDKIAGGKKQWQPVVKNFYQPFHQNLEEKTKTLTKKELTEEKTDEICEKCGSSMIIKTGRYGRFLACSNYPECKNTKPLPGQEQERPEPELVDEKCPECNAPLVKKTGRYGPFLGCSNYPECKYIKSYSQKTGVTCPKCEQGEMVSRRGKGGRSFYACDRYPKCKFVLWGKPTGKKCKVCGSLIIQKGKAEVCSNSKCTTDKNKQKK